MCCCTATWPGRRSSPRSTGSPRSARTLPGYAALLAAAGFDLLATEDRSSDAHALVRRIRRRLPWSPTVRRCEQAVLTGSLSYGLLVARLR